MILKWPPNIKSTEILNGLSVEEQLNTLLDNTAHLPNEIAPVKRKEANLRQKSMDKFWYFAVNEVQRPPL